MNSEHFTIEQGRKLEALRASEGFQAFTEVLLEWHRQVFQDFTESVGKSDLELRRLAVQGNILTELILRVDNRISDSRSLVERQMQEIEAEAQREREQVEFDEARRRSLGVARFGGTV